MRKNESTERQLMNERVQMVGSHKINVFNAAASEVEDFARTKSFNY